MCSHCGEEVDARRYDSSDTMFDWQCPACGKPISIDGNAREQIHRREARRDLTEDIIALADELHTGGAEPPPLSVEQLQTRLGEILSDVNEELDRRNRR
jgi:predicted RNA-binding Zn-ribbon protein involved in translation (DUF1610 family)